MQTLAEMLQVLKDPAGAVLMPNMYEREQLSQGRAQADIESIYNKMKMDEEENKRKNTMLPYDMERSASGSDLSRSQAGNVRQETRARDLTNQTNEAVGLQGLVREREAEIGGKEAGTEKQQLDNLSKHIGKILSMPEETHAPQLRKLFGALGVPPQLVEQATQNPTETLRKMESVGANQWRVSPQAAEASQAQGAAASLSAQKAQDQYKLEMDKLKLEYKLKSDIKRLEATLADSADMKNPTPAKIAGQYLAEAKKALEKGQDPEFVQALVDRAEQAAKIAQKTTSGPQNTRSTLSIMDPEGRVIQTQQTDREVIGEKGGGVAQGVISHEDFKKRLGITK